MQVCGQPHSWARESNRSTSDVLTKAIRGNERVAFFVTEVFQGVNGWYLRVRDDQALTFLIGLIETYKPRR